MATPGNFTASELLDVQLKAEEMWNDGIQNADLIPHAEAARAVLLNQSARFAELEGKDKDLTVMVHFIDSCNITDEACVSNCDLDEAEMSTEGVPYELDTCRRSGFKINATKLRTNIYDRAELVARGLSKAIKELDEFWARQVLLKLKTFSGANLHPQPFTYDAAKNTTVVPAAAYGDLTTDSNLKLLQIWQRQARQNGIPSPYYIDNGRLFDDTEAALLKAGATDGASLAALRRAQGLTPYTDDVNFAAAGITNATTFMVGRGSVAFKTRTLNPDAATILGGKIQQTIYTIPSRVLPNVRYDVYHTIDCATNTTTGKAEYFYIWRLETNGGIFKNPNACPVTVPEGGAIPAGTYNPTGVLSYTASDELV